MARPPSDYRDVHQAADQIGPRLAAAVHGALVRSRRQVSINRLANALATRDVKAAVAALAPAIAAAEREGFAAATTICKDAVMRGGRIGVGLIP